MRLISKDDLDEVQASMLEKRVGAFRSRRMMLVPPIVALLMLFALADHATWRRWVLGGVFLSGLLKGVIERWQRRQLRWPLRMSRSPSWSTLTVALPLGTFILATGGLDSPILPFLILLCFFVGTLGMRRVLVPFAWTCIGIIAVLATISAYGLIPNLVPAIFGGGSGVPRSLPLHLAKAAALAFAVAWASAASSLVRGIFRDMTTDAIDARDEALKSHETHSRELMALSGELAHELKNPLANVKGLAVLVGRDVQGRAAERLGILQGEVNRMEEILQGFLTFSRPLVPLSQEDVDVRRLCESAAALHEGTAHAKGVSIEVRPSSSIHVSCDPRKVMQILINLLQNALDASPAGATVALTLLQAHGGVRVEVRDHGPGVPPALQAHLFEAGWTTKDRGSGLGLALARGLARQHGGDLSLENEDDGGCRAVLTLPRTPKTAALSETAA